MIRRLALGMTVAAVVSAPAGAEDLKLVGSFGWMGVGKAFTLEQGHIYWVGEFTGTFFNDKGAGSPLDRAGVKCPGWNDLNFVTKKGVAEGVCIMNDAAGDQIYLTWKCTGPAGGMCQGSFENTGGTGKFKGATGSNTFSAMTLNWKDGTATGFALWNK